MRFSANVARLFYRENMYLRNRGISNYIFEGFMATINQIFYISEYIYALGIKKTEVRKSIISTNYPIKKWAKLPYSMGFV